MARDREASRVFLSDVNRPRLDLALDAVGGFVDDGLPRRRRQRPGRPAGADRRGRGGADQRGRPLQAGPAGGPGDGGQAGPVVYFADLPKHDPVSPLDMKIGSTTGGNPLGAYGATHRQYRITMDYLNRRRKGSPQS